MIFLKELKELCRFFSLPKAEKRIVFYAEHCGYYPYFEGLIHELIIQYKDPICYITSDCNDPILKEVNPQVKAFFIKMLLPFFMILVNCQVFIMTLTDLNQYHLKRSINPIHYVYVFHSLVSTHMMYLKGAFDYYDSILCAGQHHVQEIRRYEKLNGIAEKKLIAAGYFRLERIYKRNKDHMKMACENDAKQIILIAPSWGDQNIIESCGEKLTEILLANGYQVIMRPHPETVKRSAKLIKLIENRFEGNKYFSLERSIATDDSLLKSSLLICDCSGIAIEFALGIERPVLFIDVPHKVRNKDYQTLGIEPFELTIREKIGVIIKPENLEEIPKIIKVLIGKSKEYKQEIKNIREKYVFNFGKSSKIGAEYIHGLLYPE